MLAGAASAFADTMYKSDVEASYYADKFHGRQTASGETFNMNALTAAHKTLPFNTMVKVTNLANGKSVTVRINDRGPFVAGREIDVSKAAAVQLGMVASGTARVSLSIVDGAGGAPSPATVWTAPKNSGSQRWDIQLGAFAKKENAEALAQRLVQAGFTNVAYQHTDTVVRVVLRDIATDDVQRHIDSLERQGFTTYFVRERPQVVE